MHIGLMLDRNARQMAENILHLGIGLTACVSAKVVDRLHADEDVVDHGNNNDGTNGITPDDNNSDDRRLSAVVIAGQLINGNREEFLFFPG
jgi:hypothetical protein